MNEHRKQCDKGNRLTKSGHKPRIAHSINILEMPRSFSRSLQKKIVPACWHLGFSRKKTILDRILIRIGS